jgi:UDP-2,4-diacetamido-2,4,6-trideoxy-beta-L-altropyranose hydrolase
MTYDLMIRCDSSGQIGYGHLIRCCSLALALKSADVESIFLTQRLEGNGAALIDEAGFPIRWLEIGSNPVLLKEKDARQLIRLAKEGDISCVLVDHYGADDEYLALLAKAALRVAVIDDIADRDLWDAGWVLNQNLGAESLDYRLSPGAVKLLGPSYALLRPEFGVERQMLIRRFSLNDCHLLVTLGGGESSVLTTHVIEALAGLDKLLRIRCIIGRKGTFREELRGAVKRSPHQVELLQDVRDMAVQMAWADISINAGGSTCWELACMGVPMLVLALSSDQVLIAKSLVAQGLSGYFGVVDGDRPPKDLAEAVSSLLADPLQRANQARAGQALVDGRGAARAAESLIQWRKKTTP